MERAPAAFWVDVSTPLEQQRDCISVPMIAGRTEGIGSFVCACVDVGVGVEQRTHGEQLPAGCGVHKRSRTAEGDRLLCSPGAKFDRALLIDDTVEADFCLYGYST